jgi:hypothetical protein
MVNLWSYRVNIGLVFGAINNHPRQSCLVDHLLEGIIKFFIDVTDVTGL